MIYGRPPKAFAQIDGRWYQVYTIEFYTQVDLFGENVRMCSFYIGKAGKKIYEQPVANMELKKPKQRREPRAEA